MTCLFCRWNTQQFGRRSSFLYMSESGEGEDYTAPTSYMGGEDYVTPFAQVSTHRAAGTLLFLSGSAGL